VRRLRATSAAAIVDRARNVLGAVVHPTRSGQSPWRRPRPTRRASSRDRGDARGSPLSFARGERRTALQPEDVVVDFQRRRAQSVVLCLDTSLSMQGEKLALMGVAVAVVLLQFPDDPVAVIGFDDTAHVLKRADERISVETLIERLLDVPGRPYTNLEAGLLRALEMAQRATRGSRGRPVSTCSSPTASTPPRGPTRWQSASRISRC